MSTRILLVDDHTVIRHGLDSLLQDTPLQIAEHATCAADAIQHLENQRPDVIIMDVRMAETDGLKLLNQIHTEHPDLPVLLYSAYDNPTYLARGIALGASGYVLKSAPRDHLIHALVTVASGEAAWTQEQLRNATGPMRIGPQHSSVDVSLTHRESEVMRQMAHGLTNKEIAKMLSISYETVKEHVQHILRKLGVKDRTQAAVWAVKRNLV